MPRKPARAPVRCEYFTWRLLVRDGVHYADGRFAQEDLGKHSLGTRDPQEAMTNLRQLDRRMAVERGLAQVDPPKEPSSLAIEEGWRRYLEHAGRPQVLGGASAKTSQRYRAVRDKHLKHCERDHIATWQQIDKRSVEKYGRWLASQEYANRTVNLELTLLKSVHRWLVDEGMLAGAQRIVLPLRKPAGCDAYCYTQDEVAAMVAHCRQTAELEWLGQVIVALACTGLRISELAALRWTDFDPDLETLRLTDERSSSRRQALGTVRTTKGRRDRALPVNPALRAILEQLPRHKDGRVFHGPRGGLLKPDTVRVILIREVIEPLKERFPSAPGELGFEHGRVHSFRHFFCSEAFRGGASEAEVKAWLGHADSRMVAHYLHLRFEDSRRRMQSIDFIGTRAQRANGPDNGLTNGGADNGQTSGEKKAPSDGRGESRPLRLSQ